MESVPFTYKIYENILEIIPEEPIQDNSVYQIRIKKLRSIDKASQLKNFKIEHTTAMTPCYCTITPIQALVDVFEIPPATLWFFIRQASRQADYIAGGKVDTTNGIPFVVEKFTEVEATILALTRAYLIGSSDAGLEGTVGNVTFKNGSTVGDINKLLGTLREQEHMWSEAIRGYEFEGRNHLAYAQRGDKTFNAIPISVILNDFTRNGNLGYGNGMHSQTRTYRFYRY